MKKLKSFLTISQFSLGIMIYGIVGGMERNSTDFKNGVAYMAYCLIGLILLYIIKKALTSANVKGHK